MHRGLDRSANIASISRWYGICRVCLISHSLNLGDSRFYVSLKSYLELLDNPNDWMRIVFQLVSDLEVDLSDHARQLVKSLYHL